MALLFHKWNHNLDSHGRWLNPYDLMNYSSHTIACRGCLARFLNLSARNVFGRSWWVRVVLWHICSRLKDNGLKRDLVAYWFVAEMAVIDCDLSYVNAHYDTANNMSFSLVVRLKVLHNSYMGDKKSPQQAPKSFWKTSTSTCLTFIDKGPDVF